MGAWTDIGADLVKDRGDLQKERVVGGELMKIGERVEEAFAKVADMFAVGGIRLIALGEDARRAQDFFGEGIGEIFRNQKIVQQAFFVIAFRDAHFAEFHRLGDGEIDFEGRQECLGGLVIELVAANDFRVAEVGGVAGELAQRLERAGVVGIDEFRCDRLDFVADHDHAVDADIGIIQADLCDVAGGVFADHPQQAAAFGV